MLKKLKEIKMVKKASALFDGHPQAFYFCLLLAGLFFIGTDVFAAGTDILNGTTDDLVATINGKGKVYLYMAEGVLSLAAYIKTKNLLFLAGIIVVSVFFNVLMTVSGAAA